MKTFLLIIASIMLLATPAIGTTADLHVGSGRAYTTVASAINASVSGDRIVIHQGTYNEYYLRPKSNTTWISALRTGSYPTETMPVINGGFTSYHSNDNYDVIVLYPSTSNVTIDGLEIRNGGRDGIFLSDAGTNGITIQNCVIRMDAWTSFAVDNSSGIHIVTNATNITIRNNIIYSTIAGVHGIHGYRSDGSVKIENNEVHISGNGGGGKASHGIFWKHGGTGANRMSVKNNVVRVSGSGGNGGIWIVNNNTDIVNNLVIASSSGYGNIWIGGSMGVTGGSGSTVTHNTAYGTGWNGLKFEGGYGATNTAWRNNIFHSTSSQEYSTFSLWLYDTACSSAVTSDYNLFYHPSSSTLVQRCGSTYNLATWKATGNDQHSYFEAPRWSNESGNLNQISDFKLTSGAGKNSASDGTDMGVDVTQVGAGRTSTPPALKSPFYPTIRSISPNP